MEIASAGRLRPAGASIAPRLTAGRLLALLLLVALAVRLIGLGSRPLWLDEAYSAWFATRGWRELWTIVPTYETHPPLYYSLLKLWSLEFGDGPQALRALSVTLGLALLPVVAAAARELERQRPTGRALLHVGFAMFLCACSPMLVFLDQEARPYPLMALAYAIAALGVLRLLREWRAGAAGSLVSWAILAGGTELTLWSHALGVIYAVCLAVALAPAWLSAPLDRKRIARGTAAAALVLLLYLPCLLMMLRRAGDWGSGWLRLRGNMPFELLQLYTVPMEVLTFGSAVAALAMLLLAKRAIQAGIHAPRWNSDRALLLLWLGPPLLSIVISALWMPVFLTRTLGATVVPAFLAMSAALARSGPRERLLIALAIILPLLPTAVQVATRPAPEPWDEVGAYLQSHVGPADQVWYYPNDSMLPVHSATPIIPGRERGIPGDYPAIGIEGPIRGGSPAVVSLTAEQSAQVARDPALRSAPTIWLVTRESAVFDPAGDLPRALSRTRRAGKKQEWADIAVQPFSGLR